MSAPKRVDAIDGLRAIAMTMVIAQHCRLLPFGWIGVWLFFVISGYVITLGFLPSVDLPKSRIEILVDFLRRRVIRIVPVYLLYIAINVPIILASGEPRSLWDLPYLLVFVYNWRMVFDWWPQHGGWSMFGHLWTLSIEQQFYLLFPLLMLAVAPVFRTRWCVALILASPFLRLLASIAFTEIWHDDHEAIAFAIYASSFLHFDAFLVGVLLAMYAGDARVHLLITRYLLPITALSVLLYASCFVTFNVLAGARGSEALRNVFSGILFGQYREVFVYCAVDGIAASALFFSLKPSRYSHWLASPMLAWVGRVSYGGYLFHVLAIWALASFYGNWPNSLPLPSRIGFFLLVLGLTVAIASASFVWFERPIARRLSRQRNLPVSTSRPVMRSS